MDEPSQPDDESDDETDETGDRESRTDDEGDRRDDREEGDGPADASETSLLDEESWPRRTDDGDDEVTVTRRSVDDDASTASTESTSPGSPRAIDPEPPAPADRFERSAASAGRPRDDSHDRTTPTRATDGDGSSSMSVNVAWDLLSHPVRRHLLSIVEANPGASVSVAEVAIRIDEADLDYEGRTVNEFDDLDHLTLLLEYYHLPALDRNGLVDFDDDEETFVCGTLPPILAEGLELSRRYER